MNFFPYHYLVSGLPDLEQNELKAKRDMEAIQEWICDNLTPRDRRHFQFLIYRNDDKNLLYLMRKREGQKVSEIMTFHKPSVFSYQELEEGVNGLRDLPFYMARFMEEQKTVVAYMAGRPRENRLVSLYYDAAFELDDSFIRKYFSFKRDLKNIVNSINAKKFGFSLNDVLIGNYELVDRIKKSSAPDFGLSITHPYTNELLELIEIKDFKRLELKIDSILRDYIDEITSKDRFDVSFIFGYFIKLTLGNRWLSLDAEKGIEKFNMAIRNIIRSGEWPDGFSRNWMEKEGASV